MKSTRNGQLAQRLPKEGGEERRRVEEVKEDEEERGRRRHRLEDGPRYSGCSCRLLTECLQAGAGKEGFRFEGLENGGGGGEGWQGLGRGTMGELERG
ncbi:hypothetical protein HZH66_004073 [Vespula vulgaris]|uniref:Uncharacterized protein n=1 Tax=Vespula vulgaris TaxID=7454 RepID=A0A834NDD8_VESVU|nr:hypothetical protein HZH66_004073 [Vespula vulgaris]